MNSTMKKRLLTFVTGALITRAFGQGTINFQNINVQVPVYQSDGVTRLSGPQFLAELFAGPSATNLAAIATTSFLTTTNGAGYFDGGTVAVNTVAYGQFAWVQVDVWNTSSGALFNQAQASGLRNSWWQSSIFSVQTGDPFPTPIPPGVLIGLGNGPVFLNGVVPEPSTFALCVVGTVVALFRFRRSKAASFPPQETPGS
jgi:hypothetical protein